MFSDRENQIIQAYLEVAKNIGIESVTLQKVADHAGVAFGTVRYYFSSPKRPSLTEAGVLYVLLSGAEVVNSTIDSDRTKKNYHPLRSYVSGHFRWLRERRNEAVFLTYYFYLASMKAKESLPANQFVSNGKARLRALINEAIGMELYSQLGTSKEDIAESVYRTLIGHMVVVCMSGEKPSQLDEKRCFQNIDQQLKAGKLSD